MSTESSAGEQAATADTDEDSGTEDGVPSMESALEDEDEERGPVEIEHAPPRLNQAVAVGAALIGVVSTVPFAILAVPFGLAGFVLVAVSSFITHSRGWLSIGTALILGGGLITGAYGAVPVELMLISVGATILAWDVGQHGLLIGEQLGRQTRSRRLQVVHAASSAVVIAVTSMIGYVVYLLAGSGRPASAVALVVLGIVIMAWMYRS